MHYGRIYLPARACDRLVFEYRSFIIKLLMAPIIEPLENVKRALLLPVNGLTDVVAVAPDIEDDKQQHPSDDRRPRTPRQSKLEAHRRR